MADGREKAMRSDTGMPSQPKCGTWRSGVVTNAEAKRFDTTLARQSAEIARSLAGIEREQMSAELDRFVAALDHDLIDAADFAR